MGNFFQQLQQKASQTYGSVDKNMFRGYLPGGASREASSAVPQSPYSPGDIADKGLIPVPTVIPAVEGGAKFVKSMAGPLGRPFRVEPAIIGREKLLQDQVDRGTRSGDKVTYGLHDKGYQAPSGLKQQLERGIVGQFTGTVKDNGDVVMREGEGYQKYDTNYTPQQHAEEANKAWDKGNIGGSLMSRVYQGYSALQDRGWTNTAPQGTSEQLLGKVDNPNAQNPAPTRKAAQADITVASTAEPGPSMNYAIKAGDTLSAIARERGMSVNDIATLNNISDINQIGVGQQLRFK